MSDRTLAERILEFFTDLLETLRKAYETLIGENSWTQMELLRQDMETVGLIADLFNAALEDVTASETSANGKQYSRTSDEARYNKRGWARKNGIISAKEFSAFESRLSDLKNGAQFPKNSDGKYLFAVGSEFGVNNVIIVSDGNYEEPSIDFVYRINLENETNIDRLREVIFSHERQGSAGAIEAIRGYFGEGFVDEYQPLDSKTYRELQAGKERGGSSQYQRNYRFESDGSGDTAEIGGDRSEIKTSKDGRLSFSLKDTSPADIDRLREENQALREANKILREQFKLTEGRKVSRKAVDELSGKILKAYQSRYDRNTLTDNLIEFYDAVYKAGDDQARQEEVEAAGAALAKAVLEKSTELDDELYKQYEPMRRMLREPEISPTP